MRNLLTIAMIGLSSVASATEWCPLTAGSNAVSRNMPAQTVASIDDSGLTISGVRCAVGELEGDYVCPDFARTLGVSEISDHFTLSYDEGLMFLTPDFHSFDGSAAFRPCSTDPLVTG